MRQKKCPYCNAFGVGKVFCFDHARPLYIFVRSKSDDVITVLAYQCRTQFRGVRIEDFHCTYICVSSKCGSIQGLYVESHSLTYDAI